MEGNYTFGHKAKREDEKKMVKDKAPIFLLKCCFLESIKDSFKILQHILFPESSTFLFFPSSILVLAPSLVFSSHLLNSVSSSPFISFHPSIRARTANPCGRRAFGPFCGVSCSDMRRVDASLSKGRNSDYIVTMFQTWRKQLLSAGYAMFPIKKKTKKKRKEKQLIANVQLKLYHSSYSTKVLQVLSRWFYCMYFGVKSKLVKSHSATGTFYLILFHLNSAVGVGAGIGWRWRG